MRLKKVILVFKTHFDMGFTDLADKVIDHYVHTVMQEVLNTCTATKNMGSLKYVWTMPAWLLHTVLEKSIPSQRRQLEQLIVENQLTWHALPFTSHYDFCSYAEAIHGLKYARELSKRYHKPYKKTAKMTDVPGHGWMLPELLCNNGVRFLHIGANEFLKTPTLPSIFRWETPSGKQLVTMYNSGYGTTIFPPEDWPFDTWMAILNTIENSGPASMEKVKALVDKLQDRYPGVEVVCGSMEEFWEALKNQNLEQLPIIHKDIADTWIHGVASYPVESALIRNTRNRLRRAAQEYANLSYDETISALFQSAWDEIMLYSEHTWGLDVKKFLGAIGNYENFPEYRKEKRFQIMEKSWNDQRKHAYTAAKSCQAIEQKLDIHNKKLSHPNGEDRKGEQVLENDYFRLEYNADSGLIYNLQDKKRKTILLQGREGKSAIAFVQKQYGTDALTEYLRDYARRFSDWGIYDNARIEYPECNTHDFELQYLGCKASDVHVEFRFSTKSDVWQGGAEEIRLVLSLQKDAALAVELYVTGKQATPYVEGASLCFMMEEHFSNILIQKTGHMITPEKDIVEGANHVLYAVDQFVSAQNEKNIIGILTEDAALVSLGEQGILQYRKNYKPSKPDLHFCLWNTQWGTNFPQWIEGNMYFRFTLYSGLSNEQLFAAAYPNYSALKFPKELCIVHAERFLEESVYYFQNVTDNFLSAELRQENSIFFEVDFLGQTLGNPGKDFLSIYFHPYELKAVRLTIDKILNKNGELI